MPLWNSLFSPSLIVWVDNCWLHVNSVVVFMVFVVDNIVGARVSGPIVVVSRIAFVSSACFSVIEANCFDFCGVLVF